RGRGLRVARELRECYDTHEVAPFHRMMALRRGERVRLSGLPQREAAREPRRIRGSQRIGVEAMAVADASGARAPITETHTGRAVRVTRHDPDRRFRLRAAVVEIDHVLVRKREAFRER